MNCLMIAKLQEFTRYSSRSAYLHLPQEESANGQTQKTKQKKRIMLIALQKFYMEVNGLTLR
jgi:hypothetical protein